MSKRLGAIAGLLLIAVVAAACGSGGSGSSGSSGQSSSGSSSQAAQRIEVVGTEFAYNPGTITVKQGQPVEIVFKNEGTVPHDLLIDEFNVKTAAIAAGQSTTVRFTPSRAGQFKIYCAEPGHEAAGMVATLIVE
ncbi:MAG: cupredoxin domain-containing protein [Clostridia bacterium]